MFLFLFRAALLALIIFLVCAFVFQWYGSVKRHYAWMHPDPLMIK